MLKVTYDECTVSQKSVYKLYKLFTEGRKKVNDDACLRRPSTSTTNETTKAVKKIVMENRRITIREVAEDVGISVGSCHTIFSDILGLKRVAAKFVPKLLNFDQKTRRMTIAQEMLNNVNGDPDLLKRVITGDESWVYGYDVETKAQLSQWNNTKTPRLKKAREVRSNVKVLLTVFFDYQELLPQGGTVNKEYYLEIMRRLREAIRKKHPELWKNNSWLLHHDNAPAHSSLFVRNFLEKKKNTVIMPQPPYSPDLATCYFFLLLRFEETHERTAFCHD